MLILMKYSIEQIKISALQIFILYHNNTTVFFVFYKNF